MIIRKAFILLLFSGIIISPASAQKRPGFLGKYNFVTLEKAISWEGLFKNDPGMPVKKLNLPTIKLGRVINRFVIIGASFSYSKYNFEDKAASPFIYSGFDKLYYGNSNFYPTTMVGRYYASSISLGLHMKKYYRAKSYMPFGFYREFDIGIVRSNVTVPAGYKFTDDYDIEYKTVSDWKHGMKQLSCGLYFGKTTPLYRDKMILNVSFGATAKTRLLPLNNEVYDHFMMTVNDYLFTYQFFNIKVGVSYAF